MADEHPPPVVVRYDGVDVVRDDLIRGGTKARVLGVLMGGGAREYVYASPAAGYAQVALALTAARAGARATIFCAARRRMHARTAEAAAAGARIVPVPAGYMSHVRARARAYCALSGARLLPFGLDTPEFIAALAGVARGTGLAPSEVWCVAGSGVLARALAAAWPDAALYAVRIGAAPNAGRAEVIRAPEPFERDAREPPPFPSCGNYDAKVWQFIKARARPGAVFWNVAG